MGSAVALGMQAVTGDGSWSRGGVGFGAAPVEFDPQKGREMKMFDLGGKVAIVTGGNRGIGFGITSGLAEAGATVIIANRQAAAGRKTAHALAQKGFEVAAIPVDVSSVPSISDMVAKVIQGFKRIDILVNNAGVTVRKAPEEFTEADWDTVMDTNLKGMFFCSQVVGREMMKQKTGRIINVSSVNSRIVSPNRTVYCAAKGGVTQLTKGLAVEWAKHGITVNAIAPGLTITDINREYFEARPGELEKALQHIPLAAPADVSDYAGAAVFFASDASKYVTGQTLFVDGGMTSI
jgi:NAD(P)-dependent dehydrogenase (short-subunit alcohol dehydrogenase family)